MIGVPESFKSTWNSVEVDDELGVLRARRSSGTIYEDIAPRPENIKSVEGKTTFVITRTISAR